MKRKGEKEEGLTEEKGRSGREVKGNKTCGQLNGEKENGGEKKGQELLASSRIRKENYEKTE